MSNGSARPPVSSGLAPLLLAAGALVVYFLLISQWRAAPSAEHVERASEARDGAPQLELSRRLSAPSASAAPNAADEQGKSWLWPIAAFMPPLLIGILWGNARVRGAEAELIFGSTHVRMPEPDAPEDTPEYVADTGGSDVAESAPEDIDRTGNQAGDEARDMPQPVGDAGDEGRAPIAADHAGDAADSLPDDVEELRAALRARDEVIRTLEDIVRENRESWAEREGSADSQAQQIRALQAELDAANEVIEMLHLADGDRGREETPRPQVLERS